MLRIIIADALFLAERDREDVLVDSLHSLELHPWALAGRSLGAFLPEAN